MRMLPLFERFQTCVWEQLLKALTDTSVESNCDKKGEDVLEEGDTGNNLHIKGNFLDISQHRKYKG